MKHFAPAHTDSDIYVHFENANVLHMGDIWFNGFYPLIDDSTDGRIDGMIVAASTGLSLADDQTKIVPGHGPLGKKGDLAGYLNMLVTVRDRVSKLKAAGATSADVIAQKPTADLDDKWGHGLVKPDVFVDLVYRTLDRSLGRT